MNSKAQKFPQGGHRRQGRMVGRRSLARLNAVQALYQLELDPQADPHGVVEEFQEYRLGCVPDSGEDGSVEKSPSPGADHAFFADIVEGASSRQGEIDEQLVRVLPSGWPLDRLESVVRAILRAGTYELLARPDVPTASVINEYLNVAHAFFDAGEVPFINGVLDRLGRDLRGGDTSGGNRGSGKGSLNERNG